MNPEPPVMRTVLNFDLLLDFDEVYLGVQPSTVSELLPMVAADQLEGMTVGIAEVET
jgi:hypothetical protein